MNIQHNTYTFALCAGRHPIPGNPDAIFPETVNPLDLDGMFETAQRAIPEDCTDLTLYVTGLTVAMLTVVQVCLNRGVSLTALHFDRTSGMYYAQRMLRFDRCPFCGAPMLPSDLHCPHCCA